MVKCEADPPVNDVHSLRKTHLFLLQCAGYRLYSMVKCILLLLYIHESQAYLGVIGSGGSDLCCGLGATSSSTKWIKV